jgi:hypothetical protein
MTFLPNINPGYTLLKEVPKLVLSNPIDFTSKLFFTTLPNISNISKLIPPVKNVTNISNTIVKPVMSNITNNMLVSQFFLFCLFFILLFSLFKSRIKSSIRIMIDTKNNSEYVTTIVNYISTLPSIRHLIFNQNFYVSYDKQEFLISKDIYGRFMIVDEDTCVLEITTSTLTSTQLRQFLDGIYKNYVKSDKRQYLYNTRLSNYSAIRFEKKLFDTQITFDHLINKDIESGMKHIRFFINNRKWYEQNGFPYTLGVIVHGPSGCGKTSFIKAIANECERQVIMVPLDKKTKMKQLESLFFNEEIHVYDPKTKKTAIQNIPFHNRMYVVENIDRISSKQFSVIKELLYGLLESPERLVVFTAEKIKLVDASLLAAGRIDTQVYLDYCNVDTIMDMVSNFYETEIKDYDDFKKSLCDNVLTPSVVYEILFRNITSHDQALKELTERCNIELVEKVIENIEDVKDVENDLQEDVDSIISQELEEEKEIQTRPNFLFDSTSSCFSEKDPEKINESKKEAKDIELVDFKIPKSEPIEEIIKVEEKEIDIDIDYELSDSDFSDTINNDESGLTQSQFLKGISVISSMSDKVNKKSVIVDDFFKGK